MADNKKSAFSKPSSNMDNQSEPAMTDEIFEGTIAGNADIYKPEPTDSSMIPPKIKIDLSTQLEGGLLVLAGLFTFISLLVYKIAAFGGKHSPPDPAYYLILPIPAAVVIISLICWLFTDNYYIMDTARRKILYHYKFLWNEKINDYIDFDQIFAVGVTGKRTQHKNSVSWSYYILIIDRTGKITELSNQKNESGIDELNQKALGMASIIQCNFVKAIPRAEIKINTAGSNVSSIRYIHFEEPLDGWTRAKRDLSGAQAQWSSFDRNLKIRIILLLIFGAVVIVAFGMILPIITKI